jgi:chemotaxis protein MotB
LTKKAAAERSEVDALRAREQGILADLRAIQADRGQLRDARDAAIARTEDLAKALEQATSITQALGNQLAAERQGNSRSRAREAELAEQLDSLKSARALAAAEIASLQGRIEDVQERLADATQERVRAETKLVDLEGESAEQEQRIAALQARISALEEELKAKDGALEGLASLRTESDELRQRLAATEAQLKREEDENGRLSSELVVFHSAAKAATDVAQQHLLSVEGKIRELNDVAKLAQPSDAQPSREPKVRPQLGSRAVRDLIDSRAPPAFSVERVDSPGAKEKGRPDAYPLIAPVQAAEESSDSSLQIRMRDALVQQREQLQGLMKELDDGREALR